VTRPKPLRGADLRPPAHALVAYAVPGPLRRDLDFLVDRHEFVDQLGCQPAAGLADDVTWTDGVEQGAGLLRGLELLCPAGHQFQQQVVQAADDLGAGPAELIAAVDQQSQRDGGVVHDLTQGLGCAGRLRRRCGRRRVGLCVPDRWRRPAPGRTVSPAGPRRFGRRRPAVGRHAGRCRCVLRRPRVGQRACGRRPARPCNRRGRCRTGRDRQSARGR
jgi:hypothetical protein